ncbi:PlxyGVORF31-like protein [Hyphantria cunea granulovirus]|uniref:PlxyGVORF31-like protein n=1 Tax=Hyphantria cunea granulovirus TaxID=307448 RepID=A0AAF1D262_9BBAC|nr:PlxyGVORF31-like protein [Hyphantria cunea granulovirus]QBQ01584.1 PlxyGVORF31-like protein [Hyphantria cunea granulovirus]
MNEHAQLNNIIKAFSNKHYDLEERYHELREQHDKVQFELRCIKEIMVELCEVLAPHRAVTVSAMLDKHDRTHRTLYRDGKPRFNSIRFEHQIQTDLNSSSPAAWHCIL